ncbi:Isochorismatase-like protein [Obelidium mucronatum]|nr:Isochorismatase-like protein [Obelidium mucronatum]
MCAAISPQKGYALLLIDYQKDLLAEDGKLPVLQSQVDAALDAVAKTQASFLEKGLPVIRIGNEFPKTDTILNFFRNGACVEGTAGVAWDERLSVDGTAYFPKAAGDAFRNKELVEFTKQNGITDLVVAGLQAKACVTNTVKGALSHGLKVHLLEEGMMDSYDFLTDFAIRSLASMEGVDRFRV